jgi:hypothetical protein
MGVELRKEKVDLPQLAAVLDRPLEAGDDAPGLCQP